jgi:antitoxin YefM
MPPTATASPTVTASPSGAAIICRHRQPDELKFWSMQTLPLSDVKVRLSEIADEVDRTHERVHITRNGREYVVLMSAEDLASMEATLELLADPAAMARIRAADEAISSGEITTAEEMADIMRRRRQRGDG